jgi:protein-S-isoprenylcysteine O-methyltransferase Ste14
MSEASKNKRLYKRIFALIISGILVVIILPLFAINVSIFIDSLLGISNFIPIPINFLLATLFLINGFFWAIWSNLSIFRIGRGSPVPLKGTQTTVLVVKGPYKYTRNPMVFGYISIWIGLGFLLNSIFLLIGFTLIVTIFLFLFVKLWEEKNLEERFGESYRDYRKKVSMIFPLPPKTIK